MVDRCCSVPPEFGVLAPTAALKSTRERPLATDQVSNVPVVAKAEADAGAYTVGQTAHDLELLRSPATDLPTGQYNVGGTGECAGRVHGGPLPG